jgi:hypothetical protein
MGGAQATPTCSARLLVQLTPDVRDPQATSFLESLTADPLFKLYWIRATEDSVVLDLTGPGPEYRCQSEIRRLRRDGRVLRLKVLYEPQAPQ